MDGMASHVPFQKSSDHYPNIISSYCILSQVDKACSPVLACICFKGPAYTARLSASLLLAAVARSHPQHIGTSTSNANRPSPGSRRRRPSPSTPDVLSSSSPPPLLPGLWAPVFNRQAFNYAPMPTRHLHGQPLSTIAPLLATRQDMPSHAMPCHACHSGPMAQWA